MLAWRLCRAPFADLSGEGARRYGGRWNSPGRPVIYAASSAAFAVLEVRVHLDLPFELLPEDYVLVTLDLGAALQPTLDEVPDDPMVAGNAWLQDGHSECLQVPSFIVPESLNILINPAHQNAARISVQATRKFASICGFGEAARASSDQM